MARVLSALKQSLQYLYNGYISAGPSILYMYTPLINRIKFRTLTYTSPMKPDRAGITSDPALLVSDVPVVVILCFATCWTFIGVGAIGRFGVRLCWRILTHYLSCLGLWFRGCGGGFVSGRASARSHITVTCSPHRFSSPRLATRKDVSDRWLFALESTSTGLFSLYSLSETSPTISTNSKCLALYKTLPVFRDLV